MSDQITLEGKEYISSKRASELSGYTQDYIGQLARRGLIDARRVSGLWHVFFDSLQNYKTAAEAYKPEPPVRKEASDPDSLISFDGKDYVSAARAAKITGYHQDYVGQLARSGTIISRQVGSRWYVDREAIVKHKTEKDALLAAVQTKAVGLSHPEDQKEQKEPEIAQHMLEELAGPYLTYSNDDGDLLPVLSHTGEPPQPQGFVEEVESEQEVATPVPATPVPVRIIPVQAPPVSRQIPASYHSRTVVRSQQSNLPIGKLAAAALTVVVVVAVGFSALDKGSTYAQIPGSAEANSASASSGYMGRTAAFVGALGALLENLVVPELIYHRHS